MASIPTPGEILSKPGQLVLEVFFNDYITGWFRAHKVSSGQYHKARKELDLLIKKKQKKNKAKTNGSADPSTQPDRGHDRQTPPTEEIKSLRKQNEKLQGEISRLQKTNDALTKAKGQRMQSVETDIRFQETLMKNIQLEGDIARYKQKLKDLKEKNAEVTEYARLDKEENEKRIRRLCEQLDNARGDVENYKLRLSRLAGDKLREGNPDIADLSDPNRPTQLGTHFSEIYDNEWSDAFEELPVKNEEEKVRILHGIVQKTFNMCENLVEEQTKAVRNILLAENEDDDDNDDDSDERPVVRDVEKTIRTSNILSELKVLRKTISQQTSKNIAKKYANGNDLLKYLSGFGLTEKDITGKVKKYVQRCAELSWFMVICDPPMCLSEDEEGQPFITDIYKPYTKSPKDMKEPVVKLHVWPALKLHIRGPLVAKGVAQPGEKKKEEPSSS